MKTSINSMRHSTYRVVHDSVMNFINDDCFSMAGALAYYTLFSLPGLLVIVISLAAMFFGQEAARDEMVRQVSYMVGDDASAQLAAILENASNHQSRSSIAALLGIASLVFGATGVFAQLQSALNLVWHVQPDPKQGGVRNFLQKRALSFGLVVGMGFLLLVSLVLSAVIAAFSNTISSLLDSEVAAVFVELLNTVISFLAITLVFAAIFKIMPDAKLKWRDVWIGAAVTSLLFGAGKFAIGLYIGNSDVASAYGAAGSLATALVWIYYSSVILLAGAEFTHALYHTHGRGAAPEAGAVRVSTTTHAVRTAADGTHK